MESNDGSGKDPDNPEWSETSDMDISGSSSDSDEEEQLNTAFVGNSVECAVSSEVQAEEETVYYEMPEADEAIPVPADGLEELAAPVSPAAEDVMENSEVPDGVESDVEEAGAVSESENEEQPEVQPEAESDDEDNSEEIIRGEQFMHEMEFVSSAVPTEVPMLAGHLTILDDTEFKTAVIEEEESGEQSNDEAENEEEDQGEAEEVNESVLGVDQEDGQEEEDDDELVEVEMEDKDQQEYQGKAEEENEQVEEGEDQQEHLGEAEEENEQVEANQSEDQEEENEQVEVDQSEDEEEEQGEAEEENEQVEAGQVGNQEESEEDEEGDANQDEGQEETFEEANNGENLEKEAVQQADDQDEENENDPEEEADQSDQLQVLEEDASVDLDEDEPASPDVAGEEPEYEDAASPGESMTFDDEEASDEEQENSDGEESLQQADDDEIERNHGNLGQEKEVSAEKDDEMLEADIGNETILRGEKIMGELYYTVASEPEEAEQQLDCESTSEGNEAVQQERKEEVAEDMDTDQVISISDIQTEVISLENGTTQLLEVAPDEPEEVPDVESMDVDESPDKSKTKPVSNADFWETPKEKKREVLVAKRILKDGKKKKDSKKAGDGSKKVKKSKEKSKSAEEMKTPKRKRPRSPSKPPKSRKKTTLTPNTVKRRKIDPSLTATPSQLRKRECCKSSSKKKSEKSKKKKDKKNSASATKEPDVAGGAVKEPEVAGGVMKEPEVVESLIKEPGISGRANSNPPEPPTAAATGSVLNPPYDSHERSPSEPFVRFVCPDGEFCMLRADVRLVDERLRKFINQKGAEAGNEVVVYFPSYGRKVLKKLVETLSTINFFGEKKYRLNLALFPSDDDFDFGNKDCRNCKIHHRCVKCCYFCCCCCPKKCYDGQFITCKCINGQRYSKVSKKRGDEAGFLEQGGNEEDSQRKKDPSSAPDKSNQMPQQPPSEVVSLTQKETEYQRLLSEEVTTFSMSERAEQGSSDVIEACLWKLQSSGIKIASRPKGNTPGKFVKPKEPVKKAAQKQTPPVAKQPAVAPKTMLPNPPKKVDSKVGPVKENSVAEKAQDLSVPEKEVPEVVPAEPGVEDQEEPMEVDLGSMLSPEVVLEEAQEELLEVAEKPAGQESMEVDVTPPPPIPQVDETDTGEKPVKTIIPEEKPLEEEKEPLTKEESILETSKKRSRSPSGERSPITAKKLKPEDEEKGEDVFDKDKEKEKEKEKKKKKKDKDRGKKEERTRSRSKDREEDKDKEKKRKSSRKDKDKEKEGKRDKDRKSRKDRSSDEGTEKRYKSPEGKKEEDKNRSSLDKKEEKEQEKSGGNEDKPIEKDEEKKEEIKDQEKKSETQEETISLNTSSGEIKADKEEAGPSTSGVNPQESSSKLPPVQPGKPDKGASKRPVSLNAFPHLTVAGGFHARPSTESKMITDHPVVCEYCPRERIFATKANLNKHISVFHPGVRQALNQLPPAALAKKKDPRRRLLARAAGLPSSSEDEDDQHKQKSTGSQQDGKKGASSSSGQQNLFICPQCKSRFKTHKGYMGHMEKHKMENSKLGPPVHIK